MKIFPTVCVDNFYKDPDKIREFALNLEYDNPDNNDGSYPGKRTKLLHEIDPEFFDKFCRKLLSLYFDFQTAIQWKVSTSFQLIEPLADNPNDGRNHGWIHIDKNILFGGIIYLTPNINPNCGTSIYQEIQSATEEEIEYVNSAKVDFYLKGISTNHNDFLIRNNSRFVETARFNNIYNRLVAFDHVTYHGANNFYSTEEPRLTQTFFVERIETSSRLPLERCNSMSEL